MLRRLCTNRHVSVRTHSRTAAAAAAQAGCGGNRTGRPCRAVACLSLPEVNNVFFHLALESKEIIRRSPYLEYCEHKNDLSFR